MYRFVKYWPLIGLLGGCGDPVKRVELIEEPRVLAARVEVSGDPERATPNPGESVQVRWLVAAPAGDPPSGFALRACSVAEHTRGALDCASAPFASGVGDAPSVNPAFAFEVPAELDAALNPRFAVLGSLCASGAGSSAGCVDGDELAVSLDLYLAGADTTNENPSIPADAIAFDDVTWAPGEPPNGACSGLGLPEISLSAGQHQIQISLPDSVREALTQHSSADAPREEIRLSHFASQGELERPFSAVLPSDPSVSTKLSWKPPKSVAPSGELVRFWFVVRDLRGGSDFTERALCLLP